MNKFRHGTAIELGSNLFKI